MNLKESLNEALGFCICLLVLPLAIPFLLLNVLGIAFQVIARLLLEENPARGKKL